MRCPEVESIKTTSQVAQLRRIQSAFFFESGRSRPKSSPVSTFVFFFGLLSLLRFLRYGYIVLVIFILVSHNVRSTLLLWFLNL